MPDIQYGRRRRGIRFWLLLVLCFFIISIGGAAFIARHYYLANLKPLSNSENFELITVQSGATVKQIADELETKKVIRKSWAFQWYVRNSEARDTLQAGTYSLRPSQSVEEIVDIMTKGAIATDWITILPGKRLDEVKSAMINSGFKPEDVQAAFNPQLYEDHPALVDKPRGASLEGYLYPETFQKNAQTSPEVIIRASLDQMQSYLTPELRANIVKQGLTVHQGVILASIVEREVTNNNPEDRPKVAQVFLKRLKGDILLQSDATASYGAVLAGEEPSSRYDSAYNTYANKGLPPTPISNVTQSSLQAVANPAPTDFLYFVSGDNDINYFSRTIAEHEAFVKAYCQRKCGR